MKDLMSACMELVGFSASNKVKNHRCIGCINYVLQCPIELSEFVAFSYIQGKPSNMAEGGLNCIKYLLFGFNLMFFVSYSYRLVHINILGYKHICICAVHAVLQIKS